jgi:RES domain
MILYRHADPRFPFLWESPDQPSARWHTSGEGPVHYFADTPDGAWVEFLRHEGITDAADVENVRRALWAVEAPDELDAAEPKLPRQTLTGSLDSYTACQGEARRLRAAGAKALRAPTAALVSGGAGGWKVDGGLKPAAERDGFVVALFGPRPDLTGWAATISGRPRSDLLERVRQL